jgi:hypothetical protein
MIVFLLIALSIYALVNFYILKREWQATALLGKTRVLIFVLSLSLVIAFPLGRLTERLFPGWLMEFVDRIGAFYLVIMLYSFLLILIIDLLGWETLFSLFSRNRSSVSPRKRLLSFFWLLSELSWPPWSVARSTIFIPACAPWK